VSALPYRTSSRESVEHARLVVDNLACASDIVDISQIVDGYFGRDRELGAGGAAVREAPPLRRGNFMARARMLVLYDVSVVWGGLVVGTGNKTESLIGYSTLFGDSACAFNPIGDLYKSQVRQVAAAIGVPEEIIRKAPSADLWPGQTDEVEAGFTYPELDRLLFWMIDKRRTDDELLSMGFAPAAIARVKNMVAVSEFKRQVPPVAKLGPRTTAWTTCTRDDGPVPRAHDRLRGWRSRRGTTRGRRAALRRGHADRQPGRCHLPRDRSAADRAARCRRGHSPHATALRPLRDRYAAGELPRPERPGARAGVARTPAGRTRPGHRDRRGDAPGQRPRRRAYVGLGGRGGAVVPIPGASAVLAALVASGLSAARWTFEGFLPRSGKERRTRLARVAADERASVIYEAPSRVPATLADLAATAGGDRRAAICREMTKIHEEVVRGRWRSWPPAPRPAS